MHKTIQDILTASNTLSHVNKGITICTVADKEKGSKLAVQIITALCDRQTVLYLSGGTTPDVLYEKLSVNEAFQPGAIGLGDERYGDPKHTNSNEAMIEKTGLLRYTRLRGIPFYPILTGKLLAETAAEYDEKVRSLSAAYRRSIGIFGIGNDGHTAGLPARSSKIKVQNAKLQKEYELVTSYNDFPGVNKERITMTFLGLSMLDFLLVLVFGPEKQKALDLTFSDGSQTDIPARFYTNPDISGKTLFITDQKA